MKRIKLIFENEYGRIVMGGGSDSFMKIIEITGLGLPPREFNTVTYTGEGGQKTFNTRDLARVITISGDLYGNQHELSKVNRILYYEGELILFLNDKIRRIGCRCNSFQDPVRYGSDIKRCVIQFVCDKPEFSDYIKTKVGLFSRSNTDVTNFKLPHIFTKRIFENVTVKNTGDLEVEPVIKIKNQSDNTAKISGIKIENVTTGQCIKLDYKMNPNEEITVNIYDRTVMSTIDGKRVSIITSISADTFLSNFRLNAGENKFSVTKSDPSLNISAIMEYSNLYSEAVY